MLDLIRLAHQSLGDNGREIELLALFDMQAGQLGARLGQLSAQDGTTAASLARMLHGSASAIGAAALACSCESYLAALGTAQEAAARASLLAAIVEVRTVIADLLAR